MLVFAGIGAAFWRTGKKTRLAMAGRQAVVSAGPGVDEAVG
jgi:hypothetical protein